jgi:fatty acid/phospholipid biosynthesis enzyme
MILTVRHVGNGPQAKGGTHVLRDMIMQEIADGMVTATVPAVAVAAASTTASASASSPATATPSPMTTEQNEVVVLDTGATVDNWRATTDDSRQPISFF